MHYAVFIQTNHKQITGAIVAEYALRRYSSHNDKFDVHIVDTKDYYWFKSHEGKLYLRDGVKRVWLNERPAVVHPDAFHATRVDGLPGARGGDRPGYLRRQRCMGPAVA